MAKKKVVEEIHENEKNTNEKMRRLYGIKTKKRID